MRLSHFRCGHFANAQTKRQSLADFFHFYLITKYGLPSLCDGYVITMEKTVKKFKTKSKRVRLFGILCRQLQTDEPHAHLTDFVLNFFKLLFGEQFSAATLRSHK